MTARPNVRVAVAVAAVAILLLVAWGRDPARRPLGDPTDAASAQRAELAHAAAVAAAPAAPVEPERTRIAAAAAPSPTTLRVRFVAAPSGQPIPGLGVAVIGRDSDPWGTMVDATTDDAGLATWADLPFAAVRLTPCPGDGRIRLVPGTANEHTVRLGRPLRVEGRVVDEAGEPAVGAEVWTHRGARRRMAATLHAVADADGRFAFTAWEVGGWAYLFATRAGGVASRVVAREWRDDGRPAVVDLVVGGPAGHVAGTVLGPDGAPLGGAVVTVLGSDARPPGARDASTAGMAVARIAPPPPTRCGVDGRFVIRDVPPGRATIEVRRAGCAPRVARIDVRAGETAEVEVRMSAGCVLRGTITDAQGAPRSGVRVSVEETEAGEAESGIDGTFELRDLPAGDARVVAWSAGGALVTGAVTLVEGVVTEWRGVFPPGGAVAGTLLDARGAAVGEVAIGIDGVASAWSWTRADGGFRFEQIPDGSYDVVVTLRDGTRAIVASGVEPGAASVDARVPELPANDAAVRGRVVDPRGAPVGDAVVRATQLELHASWQARTDGEGVFQRDGLRPGRWRLVVESGRHPREAREIVVPAGAEHDVGEIGLVRRVPVDVRVAATPRAGGWSIATLWGEGFEGARCAVRGGEVELPPLRPGRYRLDVAGSDHARAVVTMVLEDGVPFEREVTPVDGVPRQVEVVLRDDEERVQLLEFVTYDTAGRELLRWREHWNATRAERVAFDPRDRRVAVSTADGRRAEAAIDGPEVRLDLR